MVGVVQELLAAIGVFRIERGADTGADEQQIFLSDDRNLECLENFLGDFLDVFALLGVGEDERKLIAAEARHRIDFTHALPQAPRRSP